MMFLGAFLAGLVGMEAVAWAAHKWLMHGPLWFLHASHHAPRKGRWEANDLFGLFFSSLSIAAIAWGVRSDAAWIGLGLGMAGYGLGYLLIHDWLVHGRFGKAPQPRNSYLQRLVSRHRIHHAKGTRDGCRHFGFLWAPRRERDARSLR
jgi:beta-carotene 3-hydroxylase